jgi:hypothetical protein
MAATESKRLGLRANTRMNIGCNALPPIEGAISSQGHEREKSLYPHSKI